MNWVAWLILTEKIRNTWPPPGLNSWSWTLLREAMRHGRNRTGLGASSVPTLFLSIARSSWANLWHVLLPVFHVKWGYSNCPAYFPRVCEGPLMECVWMAPTHIFSRALLLLWSRLQLYQDKSVASSLMLSLSSLLAYVILNNYDLFALLFLQLSPSLTHLFSPLVLNRVQGIQEVPNSCLLKETVNC